jgi:RHS repeat-associated protein
VYSYDSLNRLSSAAAYTFSGTPSTNCAQTGGSTATWADTYTLDGFGNLTNKAGTGGGPNLPIGANSNNQITIPGSQYDANGNLTAQSGVSYTYDAENHMTNFGSVSNGNRTFAYDSQNKRILNWTGSTDQNGNASGYTVYYYGVKGERLGVYNFTVGYWAGGTTPTLENSPTSTETFFGGRRLAPLDRLGSARSVNSTASSYYPFGEDKSTNPAIDAWKFGTYWRDSASGLDYATNRYYSSSLGRFLTPDPYSATVTSPSDPSSPVSWNRYAYIDGDPANQSDSTGLDYEYGDGDCPASQPSCGGATQPPPGTPIISTAPTSVTPILGGAGAVIVDGAEVLICAGSGVCEIIIGIGTVGVLGYAVYEAVLSSAQNNWPACIPPVGTIGYRLDPVPPSRPHYPITGDHVHLYKMQQNPGTGKCFWQPIGVTAPPPPPGSVPITPAGRGTD